MADELERRFQIAMLSIYQRALTEANYRASRFHQMLCKHGGLETARILLHSPTVSEGYTALWERNRLDLTVEAHVLDPQWKDLFNETERKIAADRLKEYGYQFR
jgi:hypothetical protein